MGRSELLPKGEDLRRAVRWISEHHACDLETVEVACRQFDLSPLDEEFLIRQFVRHEGFGARRQDAGGNNPPVHPSDLADLP